VISPNDADIRLARLPYIVLQLFNVEHIDKYRIPIERSLTVYDIDTKTYKSPQHVLAKFQSLHWREKETQKPANPWNGQHIPSVPNRVSQLIAHVS
jgi:hypothetical protein